MPATPKSSVKVLSALLTALPGKAGEFQQTLKGLQTEIQDQPGCLECVVGQDLEGESRFIVFMAWQDQTHLEAHLDSEAFRILLGAASLLTTPSSFRYIAANAKRTPQAAGSGRRSAARAQIPAS